MKGTTIIGIISGLCLMALTASADSFTWTGSADSLWSNASNWSGGTGYPDDASDDVTFNNNTVSESIYLTENITINTFTWNEKKSRGFNLNGFDLTINGVTNFANSTRLNSDKSDGQFSFGANVTFGTGCTIEFFGVTQTSGTMSLGSETVITLKNPSTRVDISLNHVTMADRSGLLGSITKNLSIVDFTVGDFCVIEFPRNKTTTISGTATLDQADCSAYSTYRSYTPGTQAELIFTGGPATGDFNVFEDIEIITSGDGNTFTADSHTDLGNNTNISGTTLAATTCTFDGNGNTTGDWSDNTEWTCGCVPRSVDDVTIAAGVTVDIDDLVAQCDDLSFASSTSAITGGTGDLLEIHGTLTTTATDNFSGFRGTTEFRNNATGASENLTCSGCDTLVFYGPVKFEFPGNTWVLQDHLKVQDDNDKRRGDLTITRGTVNANNFDVWVESDFNNTSNGTFTPGTGELRMFDGSTSSVKMDGGGTIYDLVINKGASSNTTSIESVVTVTNLLDLSNAGIVEYGSTNDTLILADNATVTGASDNSHVNGYFKKIGNDDFTFPVGNGTYYRPIGVSDMASNSTATTELVATYYLANPIDSGMVWNSWESPIQNVSTREYWDLSVTSGAPTPKIVLSWDAPTPSGTIGNTGDLRVAHWTGSIFEDLGHGSVAGTTSSGTLTSADNVTSFSPFVLASSNTTNNPLPVSLLDFRAKAERGEVKLNWETATEVSTSHFEVERTTDQITHEVVAVQDAAGFSNAPLTYRDADYDPVKGMAYYRLKTVDLDGSVQYSPYRAVKRSHSNAPVVNVFPNPARVGQSVWAETSDPTVTVELMHQHGGVMHLSGTGNGRMALPDNLPAGTYFLRITDAQSGVQVMPLIVQ